MCNLSLIATRLIASAYSLVYQHGQDIPLLEIMHIQKDF